MTKLYLIRHAEAEGNLYRISQGQSNSAITDRGYLQIAALQKRFEGIPIDAVYSSDLCRTCVTAGALYLPRHLPLHKRKDLREIHVGDWEGMTWGEIAQKFPEEMTDFARHLDRWYVKGAETPEQVRDRMLNAIREIIAENEGKTVAIFSHGCSLRILLGTLQGYSLAQLGDTPCGENTAVSLIDADGGTLRVVFRDDGSHLREAGCAGQKFRDALNPGLYFTSLRLPEQSAWLKTFLTDAWPDSRSVDGELLIRQAKQRPTLTAMCGKTPIGLIQLDPERDADQGRGWISLYILEKKFRRRGLGIQLLGQAVLYYRSQGRNTLCLELDEGNEIARSFFNGYGFAPLSESPQNRVRIWAKDIRLPEV